MLNLNNITLTIIDGINPPDLCLKTLLYCSKDIKFHAIKLFSFAKPSTKLKNIEFIKINKLNLAQYNEFILRELYKYIYSDFCLLVQTDGFIINPHLWNYDFLKYDYIGAPWPDDYDWINKQKPEQRHSIIQNYQKGIGRVGNGGFSLRSKKLLNLSANAPFLINDLPEDNYICMHYIDYFLNLGITFAPPSLAADFSLENPVKEKTFDLNTCFGFHGKHKHELKLEIDKMKFYNKKSILRKLKDKIFHIF
ncbi:MAG: hypothetical protein KA792_04895 [Bacteroidales bacterium]|nr:hypothetical protein [Bacteroidales bacterium]